MEKVTIPDGIGAELVVSPLPEGGGQHLGE